MAMNEVQPAGGLRSLARASIDAFLDGSWAHEQWNLDRTANSVVTMLLREVADAACVLAKSPSSLSMEVRAMLERLRMPVPHSITAVQSVNLRAVES